MSADDNTLADVSELKHKRQTNVLRYASSTLLSARLPVTEPVESFIAGETSRVAVTGTSCIFVLRCLHRLIQCSGFCRPKSRK